MVLLVVLAHGVGVVGVVVFGGVVVVTFFFMCDLGAFVFAHLAHLARLMHACAGGEFVHIHFVACVVLVVMVVVVVRWCWWCAKCGGGGGGGPVVVASVDLLLFCIGVRVVLLLVVAGGGRGGGGRGRAVVVVVVVVWMWWLWSCCRGVGGRVSVMWWWWLCGRGIFGIFRALGTLGTLDACVLDALHALDKGLIKEAVVIQSSLPPDALPPHQVVGYSCREPLLPKCTALMSH